MSETTQRACRDRSDSSGPRTDRADAKQKTESWWVLRSTASLAVSCVRSCLRPESLIPLLVFLSASVWFLQSQYSRSGFPLDDAWIHRVYARSLAMGQGLAFNPGQQETGSTSPLWVIISAPAHWLGFLGTGYVVAGVKLIGWVFGAVVVCGVVRLGQLLTGSRFVAGGAGLLVALESRLLFSAFSGMEATLLVALWLWACIALVRKRYMAFLLLLGLAPLARPEALVLLPLALLAMPGVVRTTRPPWQKLGILTLPLVPQLLWSAVCLSISQHPLPNTFYLKAQPFALGTAQLAVAWNGLVQQGLPSLRLFALGLLVFLGFCVRAKGRPAWQCVAMIPLAATVYLLGVCGTRTVVLEGYYWTRWLDPAAMVLSISCCVGISLLVWWAVVGVRGLLRAKAANGPGPRETRTRPGRELALRVAAGVLALVFVAISAPQWSRTLLDRRSHLATDSRAIDIMNVQMGKWIHDNTPREAVVGVIDAGAIRYFGERKTIDLVGLNNTEIARGSLTLQGAVRRCDWLACYPDVLPPDVMQTCEAEFEVRQVIQIPLEEYTVCRAVQQTYAFAMRRKSGV